MRLSNPIDIALLRTTAKNWREAPDAEIAVRVRSIALYSLVAALPLDIENEYMRMHAYLSYKRSQRKTDDAGRDQKLAGDAGVL